jgi:hypothetical protein
MKKNIISMILLGAMFAAVGAGCGSLPKRGAPPTPPAGAPARP